MIAADRRRARESAGDQPAIHGAGRPSQVLLLRAMKFSTRSIHHLRISRETIILLLLHLDARHVDWMSERILNYVLADLRPLSATKFQLIPSSPADTIDRIRGKLEEERDMLLGLSSTASGKQVQSKARSIFIISTSADSHLSGRDS